MIKTLSDYNLLESEEWKDSINTLFLELRSKLPEFFKEVPLPTIPHEDYVEVVIPASKQVMMEDLVEWLEKKLGLHILYASKQNYGKLLKAAVVDCGRAFLMGELIFILLMAGMVYPFKQLPPVPGMKSRWRSLGSWPRGRNAA